MRLCPRDLPFKALLDENDYTAPSMYVSFFVQRHDSREFPKFAAEAAIPIAFWEFELAQRLRDQVCYWTPSKRLAVMSVPTQRRYRL